MSIVEFDVRDLPILCTTDAGTGQQIEFHFGYFGNEKFVQILMGDNEPMYVPHAMMGQAIVHGWFPMECAECTKEATEEEHYHA